MWLKLRLQTSHTCRICQPIHSELATTQASGRVSCLHGIQLTSRYPVHHTPIPPQICLFIPRVSDRYISLYHHT